MELSFKYRIYPNVAQQQLIGRTFGCVRYVYNRVLAMRKQAYADTGKTPHIFDYIKMLTDWKNNPDTCWLGEVDSIALQQSLRNLDRAYQNFFRSPAKMGFPRFKSKHDRRHSYRTMGAKIIDGKHVRIPKVGTVKARVSRPTTGRIVSATIKQEPSGKYFIIFCCTNVPNLPPAPAGTSIGVDVGVKDLVVTSDGRKYSNPKATSKYARRLARAQRRLSRKKKGSRNYAKQRIKVSRTHEKITNTRLDQIHKVTSALTNENQVVCVENLDVKTMLKRRRLAKGVSDASFGQIIAQMEYKTQARGGVLVRVDRWFPSTKTCHTCGRLNNHITLEVRRWQCPNCQTWHDRDINAAKNILAQGIKQVPQDMRKPQPQKTVNACGVDVRPKVCK